MLRVGTLRVKCPVSSAPSVTWGFTCCRVKVRWRKPAGTRRFAEAIEAPTEDRAIRRLQADIGSGVRQERDPRQIGFGAEVRRRQSVEDAGREETKTDAAD